MDCPMCKIGELDWVIGGCMFRCSNPGCKKEFRIIDLVELGVIKESDYNAVCEKLS